MVVAKGLVPDTAIQPREKSYVGLDMSEPSIQKLGVSSGREKVRDMVTPPGKGRAKNNVDLAPQCSYVSRHYFLSCRFPLRVVV